jgi:hypothetical protein
VAARFEVTLRGGERDGDVVLYEPAEEIAGSVEVEVDRATECRSLWVRLIWHTEGRGDEDTGKIEEMDIYGGGLSPGSPIRSDFRFLLPFEPWSYAGQYVSIVWAIEVTVDVPMARDLTHRHRFVMRPRLTSSTPP